MAPNILKPYRLCMVLITYIHFFSLLPRCEALYFRYIAPHTEYIKNSMSDIVANCWRRMESVDYIKQLCINQPAFEVGYLVQLIQEKYRKMVERFQTCESVVPSYTTFELIIYLEEIEHAYWQVEHLVNMAHEIERKFDVRTTLVEPYEDPNSKTRGRGRDRAEPVTTGNAGTKTTPPGPEAGGTPPRDGKGEISIKELDTDEIMLLRTVPTYTTTKRTRIRKTRNLVWQETTRAYVKNFFTTKTRTGWSWPIEYGWEIDDW